MKNTMKFFGFLAIVLSLSLFACKGEMGDVGPAGPAGTMGVMGEKGDIGPEGPAGPAGEDGRDGADGQDGQDGTNGTNGTNGQDGEDGEDGNANVFSSPWVSIDWDPNSTLGFYDATAPEITNEAIENALILGFVRLNANSWVYGLPIRWFSGEYFIQFATRAGVAEFYYITETAGTAPAFEGKYVIIPPAGRLAANSSNPKAAILQEFKDAGVDINDYDQVAKYLEIR